MELSNSTLKSNSTSPTPLLTVKQQSNVSQQTAIVQPLFSNELTMPLIEEAKENTPGTDKSFNNTFSNSKSLANSTITIYSKVIPDTEFNIHSASNTLNSQSSDEQKTNKLDNQRTDLLPSDSETHSNQQNVRQVVNNNITNVFICCTNSTLPCSDRACYPGTAKVAAILAPIPVVISIDYIAHIVDPDMDAWEHHLMIGLAVLASNLIPIIALWSDLSGKSGSKSCQRACLLLRFTIAPLMVVLVDLLFDMNGDNYSGKPEAQLWASVAVLAFFNIMLSVPTYYKKLFPQIKPALSNNGSANYQSLESSMTSSNISAKARYQEAKTKQEEEKTKQKALDMLRLNLINKDEFNKIIKS